MKYAVFLFCLLCLPFLSKANDYYVGQSVAGSGNGSTCANQDAYTGTHITTASNWVPGITWHICGTLTPGGGAVAINVLGSGTSSNPITIKFENGAQIQSPYFPAGTLQSSSCPSNCGVVQDIGFSNIIIDGGTNGLVTATANGSPSVTCQSGFACANQERAVAVSVSGNNIIVRNLTVTHVYDNCGASSSCNDQTAIGWAGGIRVDNGATNVTVCNNSSADSYAPISIDGGSSTSTPLTAYSCSSNIFPSGVHVFANTVNDGCHLLLVNGGGQVDIALNDFQTFTNWYYPSTCHADGMIAYGDSSAVTVFAHHNRFMGDLGPVQPTGFVFGTYGGTGSGSKLNVYRNLFVGTGYMASGHDTIVYFHKADGHPLGPHQLYNNTYVSSGYANTMDGDTTQSYSWENNIADEQNCSGSNIACWVLQGSNNQPWSTLTLMDYNDYYPDGSNAPFNWNSGVYQFSAWQTACSGNAPSGAGCDAHSVTGNPDLNTDYTLGSGSAAIAAGVDLSSLESSLPGINYSAPSGFGVGATMSTTTASASGAWDMGAYVYGSTSPTVTKLCSVLSSSSCTVSANVPSGAGIVVIFTNEDSTAPSYTVTDSCGDTYGGQLSVASSAAATGFAILYTTSTCAMTSGTSTISENTQQPNVFLAYAITPFATSNAVDVNATSIESNTTSFSAGPTSNTTASDVCIAVANAAASGLTWSVSNPWTLAGGSNSETDNRTVAAAYRVVSSGTQVTGNMTANTDGAGGMAVQCLKTH